MSSFALVLMHMQDYSPMSAPQRHNTTVAQPSCMPLVVCLHPSGVTPQWCSFHAYLWSYVCTIAVYPHSGAASMHACGHMFAPQWRSHLHITHVQERYNCKLGCHKSKTN